MRHRADEFAVLDYGAAAHALHYAAGELQEGGVGYGDQELLAVRVRALYLDGVLADLMAGHVREYRGRAVLYLTRLRPELELPKMPRGVLASTVPMELPAS